MKLLLFLLNLVFSVKVLEYRFANNFGQLFDDFSGNSQFGLNGQSNLTEKSDALCTDRGVFFDKINKIQLPPNPYQPTSFTLPPTFSIFTWQNTKKTSTGNLFSRKLSSTEYFVIKIKSSKMIDLTLKIGSKTYTNNFNTATTFDEWNLVGLIYENKVFKVCMNSVNCFSFPLATDYVDSSYPYKSFSIGESDSMDQGFIGFVWNFIVYDQILSINNFLGGALTTCFTGTCNCKISAKDEILGNSCINDENNEYQNSNHDKCTCGSGYSCAGPICMNCPSSCSPNSCSMGKNNAITCLSITLPKANGGCLIGQYLDSLNNTCKNCHSSCLICTMPDICSVCKFYNSEISSIGCNCISGYWGDSPVTNDTTCQQCHEECLTCSNSSSCISCVSINAIPKISAVGCSCIEGFYSLSPLTTLASCIECHPHCKICVEAGKCSQCKDINAEPNASSGCNCKTGYYNNTLTAKCEECHYECNQCADKYTCSDCKDLNAVPRSVGCDCKDRYYNSSSNFKCEPCNEECSSCLLNGFCEECVAINAVPYNNQTGCYCKPGFFLNSSILDTEGCQKCNENCLICIGKGIDECLECSKIIFNGICFEFCPLGYYECEKTCCEDKKFNLLIKYTFESVGSVYYDEVNDIPAFVVSRETGLNEESPSVISVLDRGVYMSGLGGLNVDTKFNSYIFTDKFTLSAWVYPEIDSFTLTYKDSDSGSLLLLNILLNSLCFDLKTKETVMQDCSQSHLTLNSWNHLFLVLNYTTISTIKISINGKNPQLFSYSNEQFIGSYNTSFFIGCDKNLSNSFTGFLYIFELFLSAPLIFDIVDTSKDDFCTVHPKDQSCISTCNLTEYQLIDNKCEPCGDDCESTCKNKTHCSLCEDLHCVACESFGLSSCTKCDKGFEVIAKTCTQCNNTSFYNSYDLTCHACSGLCFNCLSQDRCLSCRQDSELNKKNQCICKQGFHFDKGNCIRNVFDMKIMTYENNTIYLIFNESLKESLQIQQLDIKADNLKKIEVFEINKKKFMVNLIFSIDVRQNSTALIEFIDEICSEENSLLLNKTYSIALYETKNIKSSALLEIQKNDAVALATKVTIAGVSVNGASSMIQGDLNSIFTFLSTAEMFFSVYFFDFTMYEPLSAFLRNLRVQSSIPNLFSYIVDENKGEKLPQKYRKFGFKSNLLMLNCGVHFMFLGGFLLAFFLLVIVKNFLKHMILDKFMSYFKYSVFLRIWVQSYFEVLHASIIGLKYNSLKNSVQIIDAVFSCVIIVFFSQALEIFALFFISFILYKRSKLTDKTQTDKLKQNFATFFEEFKDTDIKVWCFFFLYILRRLFLTILITFGIDEIFQLSFSLTAALVISFYVLVTQCFVKTSMNIFHIVNEVLIASFYSVLLAKWVYFTHFKWEDISSKCIIIISIAWSMNMALGVYLSIIKIAKYIIELIKKRRFSKVVRIESQNNITGDSRINQAKIEIINE